MHQHLCGLPDIAASHQICRLDAFMTRSIGPHHYHDITCSWLTVTWEALAFHVSRAAATMGSFSSTTWSGTWSLSSRYACTQPSRCQVLFALSSFSLLAEDGWPSM